MKLMLRNFLALLLAVLCGLVGFSKPVLAVPIDASNWFNNIQIYIDSQSNSGADSSRDFDALDPFVRGLGEGALQTGGVVLGGMLTCYAIDGIATAVFPPAAAAAALCPAMPTVAGGATASFKIAPQIVKAF
ncbi:MAG: hypothetical protein AAFW84_32585 [Cyanobacteria bacterium J06635_15]